MHLSLEQLAEQTESSVFLLRTEASEQRGIIKGCINPSDLMHVKGSYTAWDSEGAQLATEIMANRLKLTVDDFIQMVYTELYKNCII